MSMPTPSPTVAKEAGSAHGDPSTIPHPHVVLPTVALPILSPGYPLARNTAAIEAATLRYFQPGQSTHGKRGRSGDAAADRTTTITAVVATPPTVLDTLDAEVGGIGTSAGAQRVGAGPMPTLAYTRSYLTNLFQEPTRQEEDVYRPVDVVRCRRELRAEEAVVLGPDHKDATTNAAAAAAAVPATSAAQEQQHVRDFNSCLTMGQHRRYRTLVLEWLRHQPSRSAPPNSGEVLKVVQQEQKLFLTVLRREAIFRAVAGSVSSYEWLPPTLISFAQQSRILRMRRQLLSFLDDAKSHTRELLTCRSPAAMSSMARDTAADGAGGAAVDADYGGISFERDEAGAESAATAAGDQTYEPTAQQLYNRRYPSLRVLQMHMARLYNALQDGLAAPFPNPQVQSIGSGGAAAALEAGVAAAAPSPTAPGSAPLPPVAPSHLSLKSLPTTDDSSGNQASGADDDGAEGEEETGSGGGSGSGRASRESLERAAEAEGDAFVAHHIPLDGATPLPAAKLRAYVEQHLLRRFGWRPHPHHHHQPADDAAAAEDVVGSISLSITTAALVKLFVAHVDTEEPRTSFRLPVRVQLSPVVESGGSSETPAAPPSTSPPRYRAHVMIGDSIPNVRESRQSVQLAAAEYLLRQHYATASAVAAAATTTNKAPANEEAAGSVSPTLAAQVLLSRTGSLQSTEAPSQPGGSTRLTAAATHLASEKDTAVGVAPVLPFHVVTPATAPAASCARTGAHASHVDFVLAKMEHLHETSAARVPSASAQAQASVAHLQSSETALRCPFLLELLSPREMLQLDLLFSCHPAAVVRLHRVQLTPAAAVASAEASTSSPDATTGSPSPTDADAEVDMQVLAIETLTCGRWAHLRAQLLHRPIESLLAAPTPAEVLATQSWDLLYDTLAWLLDAVERHASDALRAALASAATDDADAFFGSNSDGDEGAEPACGSNGDRFLYLILSNHANLVNTTAKAKFVAKGGRPAPASMDTTSRSFTESRFAVFYVLQDASELYPEYEPRIDVTFEASSMRFLEQEGGESDGEGEADGAGEAREEGRRNKGRVAARLYRDPHTWNADTIPFTFHRTAPAAAAAPLPVPHS